MTRTVSLERSRSSSSMICPWKSGDSKPSTRSWTGPIDMGVPFLARSQGRSHSRAAHPPTSPDGGEPAADRPRRQLRDGRADERSEDDVAGEVHARVDARVADDRGERA